MKNNIIDSSNPLTVYLTPGIGDCLFGLSRIYANTNRPLIIKSQRRINCSSPFLKDLLGVIKVEEHGIDNFMRVCEQKYIEYKEILDNKLLNEIDEIFLYPNTHVDSGKRVENYLPKLENTTFDFK